MARTKIERVAATTRLVVANVLMAFRKAGAELSDDDLRKFYHNTINDVRRDMSFEGKEKELADLILDRYNISAYWFIEFAKSKESEDLKQQTKDKWRSAGVKGVR